MPGRQVRQRRGDLYQGLLAAAAPPEDRGGGPGAVPARRPGRAAAGGARSILQAAGYVGAATCEFLLGRDGTLAFLETNARLAVAHPVSEEVAGLDLVRETFRMAEGEPLGYGDPQARGHAIQFRIYAEDPGRGFAPAPGTVRDWNPPSGPGVRLDPGAGPGSVVAAAFGTLLAKLIVTGASRAEALQRASRALREFEVGGLVTSLSFYRRLVTDEAFAPPDPGRPFSVHAGWIESTAAASVIRVPE